MGGFTESRPIGRSEGFWRRPWIEQVRRGLRQPDWDEAKKLARRTDERSQISALLQTLHVLESDAAERRLPLSERTLAAATAYRILAKAGIGSNGSKLSPLHDELMSAIGARLDYRSLALVAGAKAHETIQWLARKGEPQNRTDAEERARRLRWTGDLFQAGAELAQLSPGSAKAEKLLLALGHDGDLSRFPAHAEPPAEVYLWAYALPARTGTSRFPKCVTGIIGTLENAYNLSLSKAERWALLVDVFETEAASLSTQEFALLLGAVARWCLRNRERAAAERLIEIYGGMARILSHGFSADHLGLFEEQSRPPSSLDAVPLTWQRAGAFSTLSFEACLLLGRLRFSSLFGNEERKKRLREEEAKGLTTLLLRHLSGLKGPVMKLGQTASYFGWQLPGVASDALSSLQSESVPVETGAVVKVIEQELGRPLGELFAAFDETPCGVGSIGQVHRAVLHTGEAVAVKVQFPGIEEAIRCDVGVLHLALPILRLLTASAVNRDLLGELKAQLLNECDYVREARLMERLRRQFRDVPSLHFPHVHAHLSTRRVLVTDFVRGKTLEQFRRDATLDEKQAACQSITEYIVRGCCLGLFNSDPHPGNFLFHDGKVTCLDFGAVKEWPKEVSVPWAKLILAGVTRDYPLFLKSVEQMNIITDHHNFDFKQLYAVYTGGAMGNTTADLPQRMTHEQLHAELKGYADRKLLGHTYFNPNYLYGIRVYTGLISILALLNAPINYFSQIKEICERSLTANPPDSLPPLTK